MPNFPSNESRLYMPVTLSEQGATPSATVPATHPPHPTPTVSIPSTPPPSATMTATPPTGGGCTAPTWQPTTIYIGGDEVSHYSHQWRARWWTQGDEPGSGGAGEVWLDLGPCGAATATVGATISASPLPSATGTPRPTQTPCPSGCGGSLPTRLLVGYWHNFDNGSTTIRLRDVAPAWDVIQVAFAEPDAGSVRMHFTPFNATPAEFQQDIALLQSQGKRVLISVGGANAHIQVQSAAEAALFASSMIAIIEQYGFDGIDIDLEGGSLSLAAGDGNFRAPTTPRIVHFIAAVETIVSHFGPDLMLTAAPETAYVQGGHSTFAGLYGAYLPLLYAFHDRWSFVHVQHYNTGCMVALDGHCYGQGTADFQVAMAEMMVRGFPVPGHTQGFPAFRSDQVLIGLPAAPQAAGGGYTPPALVHQALTYLIRGIPFGGQYLLQQPGGYPAMRGLMTWSINWDAYTGFGFSDPHRAFLDGLD